VIPADLGRGADHHEHGEAHDRTAVAPPQPGQLVAPQLLVDLADELFRFHAAFLIGRSAHTQVAFPANPAGGTTDRE
jgi:hypothetical protein